MSKIYFISGHGDLTQDEFDTHYRPYIDKAIAEGASFLVGDYTGCAKMSQMYLRHKGVENVTIYHMFWMPRYSLGYPMLGGFKSDNERDTAMTNISDEDIAWVRPGKERSGTAKNKSRRAMAICQYRQDKEIFEMVDFIIKCKNEDERAFNQEMEQIVADTAKLMQERKLRESTTTT